MAHIIVTEKTTGSTVVEVALHVGENASRAFYNICINYALKPWEHDYRVEGALA